jgi:hypothetical protein
MSLGMRTWQSHLCCKGSELCIGSHLNTCLAVSFGLREEQLLPQGAERHVWLLWQKEAVLQQHFRCSALLGATILEPPDIYRSNTLIEKA